MAADASRTFVTTCKDRLDHLKQSLPRLLEQQGCTVLVVDSRCPQGTGDWVERNHPQVEVVRHDDGGVFNLAAARNAGLAACRSDFVAFIDADVLTGPRFAEVVVPHLKAGTFVRYEVPPELFGLDGSCIVEREAALGIGGYDTLFEGWGGEDTDFYLRLELGGQQPMMLPSNGIIDGVIRHEGVLRSKHHAEKDIRRTLSVAYLYIAAKKTYFEVTGVLNPPESTLRELRSLAERAVETALASPDRKAVLTLNTPVKYLRQNFHIRITRTVTLTADLSKTFT
jgi:glycosyltransferase involved in cell wall biosynthesis